MKFNIPSFKQFISEATIPYNIISQFEDIAGPDGTITMYDLYNMQQSFVKGSTQYRDLMGFLFNNSIGTKFFSIFSTGFTVDDLKNFDSDKMKEYLSLDDDIKKHSEQLVYKFKDFSKSEIVYQLYKYVLEGNNIDFKTIKEWIKSKPALVRLFDSQAGKLTLGKIYERKIKTINDVINFLSQEDKTDSGTLIDINDVECKFKKFNSDVQTYFKDAKHLVCAVYVKDDIREMIEDDVKDKDQMIDYGSQRATMSQVFSMYSDSVTSHSATVAVGHFTLGWVRFSVKNIDGEQVCIIDELQSDLSPYTGSITDQHKVYLPEETFETFLKDVNYIYKLILQKFIYEIRDEYGYEQIYAPTYDIKKEVTKIEGDIDKGRFEYLSDEDIEGLKNIKPPMFPYKQIIPSFGFTKTNSMLPGFLVLEDTQLQQFDILNELMFFNQSTFSGYELKLKLQDRDQVADVKHDVISFLTDKILSVLSVVEEDGYLVFDIAVEQLPTNKIESISQKKNLETKIKTFYPHHEISLEKVY